jgi:hypothetical protein
VVVAVRAEARVAPATEDKHAGSRRHPGLRFIKPRGGLSGDGRDRKRFAVIAGRLEDGAKASERHREKAGTAGHVHGETKNELAAERLPGRKSGANAAWSALNAIAGNAPAAAERARAGTGDADRGRRGAEIRRRRPTCLGNGKRRSLSAAFHPRRLTPLPRPHPPRASTPAMGGGIRRLASCFRVVA